jgi:Raf kinase inhibitor-like YbhB/YbcL family protein
LSSGWFEASCPYAEHFRTIAQAEKIAVQLRSPSFADGSRIPVKYTGDGEDISPPLEWSQAPANTKELALICDDPDAPTPQPWIHWVLYRIPNDTTSLSEGVSHSATIPGVEGKNSWKSGKTIGYRGPAPPRHGVHHYHFRLYAIDTALTYPARMDKQAVLSAIQGHVLAQAELVGTYERK